MFKAHRHLPAYLLSAGLLIAASACASGGYYGGQRTYSRSYERLAYQNGFDRGVRNGERDARDRRDFSYSRDREYRDADWGFRRGEIDRDDYRRAFRRGFEDGYSEGFNRAARAYGPNYPRYPGANAPYGYPRQGPAVPRAGYGYGSIATQNGYRDGLEAGRNDARDRQHYDPIRPKRYREGDHDYDSRYGSRDDYKREYRAAFQQGYEAGYREYRW
jgi:hypothetical protein